MKTRVEYKEKFNVYGYTSPLLNEASHEREVTLLRENYESKLKSILKDGDSLNFVIWFEDETHWFYHFGVETWDNFADEDATCVEVSGGYYFVGTFSTDVPISEAWEQLMGVDVNSTPVVEIIEHGTRKYFERFDKDGNYELWAPIVNQNS